MKNLFKGIPDWRWKELKCINCMHGVSIYHSKEDKKMHLGHYGHAGGYSKHTTFCQTYHCECRKPEPWIIKVGHKVKKVGGDYSYEGLVVAVVVKLSGRIRYVVEDDKGMLFIFNNFFLASLYYLQIP